MCKLLSTCILSVFVLNTNIQAKTELKPHEAFERGFSVKKMDDSISPKTDFYRYSSGTWLDNTTIPSDQLSVSTILFQIEQIKTQLESIVLQASKRSSKVAKGSAIQQVGDYYRAGINKNYLTKLGISPLEPLFKKINAITSPQSLAQVIAELQVEFNSVFLIEVGISADINDIQRYSIFIRDAGLDLQSKDLYLKKENAHIRKFYLKYITEVLTIAGVPNLIAAKNAQEILSLETRIATKKLSPVDMRDPNKKYTKMSFSQVESLLSNIDIKVYFKTLNLPTDSELIVLEKQSLENINQIMGDYSLEDIKTYLRWQVLRKSIAYLTPEFDKPIHSFNEAVYNKKMDIAPRSEKVTDSMRLLLGHPLSQLYISKYFSNDVKIKTEAIVADIKSLFRNRLVNNNWLSESTKKTALEKLDKTVITVGYPEQWINMSLVDIRADDYFGNMLRLNEFKVQRNLSKYGKAVTIDGFSVAGSTMPIDTNAAYSLSSNKIEIPAAFIQAPFYDSKVDIAVNYCSLGAVIGHEITHGFDSQGRLYDPDGNIRNWWTDEDAANFKKETAKLVKQADNYEVLPGLTLNGKLTVGENLADVGGISLGYEALEKYLLAHPQENKKIDGLTPQQRCFLTWGQLWASKTNPQSLRQTTATDPHPARPYRTFSPSQHNAAFFKAFDIKKGDPMWLDKQDRVNIW